MTSNPLMMACESGDLLLTGQWSGRCPSLCVQAVGGGLGSWRLRLVTRVHLRWLDHGLRRTQKCAIQIDGLTL